MTWTPAHVATPPVPEFTDEERMRYATYHWRQTDDGDAHVWRTIGAECRYLGTATNLAQGLEPAEQLPLIPSLETQHPAGGPTSSLGGPFPYQEETA